MVDSSGRQMQGVSSKRQMELMPSVSRSSGLDKDGDSLKDHKVQEEYRNFIEEKLAQVLRRIENLNSEAEDAKKHQVEEQENILILYRKLREGISSTSRVDGFSVEVYERSLYLSIIFTSPKHTAAIIPALLDDLYLRAFSPSTDLGVDSANHNHHRHMSLLISLIHHLATQFPSQSPYHHQISSMPKDWLPSDTRTWLGCLTRSLRTGNYYQLGILTGEQRVSQLHDPRDSTSTPTQLHDQLAVRALTTAIDALRSKARASSWRIMRAAYRELWFEEPYDTRHWLRISLEIEDPEEFDQWLAEVEKSNEMKKKDEFFKNARRIFLWQPTMIDNSIHQTFHAVEISDNQFQVMNLLARHVIPGVEHDSSEREPPRCHPGTRVELCESISHDWLDNTGRQHRILWLHGLAGVGKSAIMQTLAEAQDNSLDSILGAAIFLSRRKQRNDPRRLLTSIAYQLAVRYPEYRIYLSSIVSNDPRIVEKSMSEQFEWFIVKPFVEQNMLQKQRQTVLLMIDGLDECQGEEAQRNLVLLIGRFAFKYPQTAILWAVASRPEPHIQAAFALPDIHTSYWDIEVPVNSDQTFADIERFLGDKFEEIRQRYPSFFPAFTSKWPSDGDFLKIVNASAGLFIFASTVVSFIIDESYGNPISQLKRVLDLIDRIPSAELRSSPLQTLDNLYTEILSAIPIDVLPITRDLLALSFSGGPFEGSTSTLYVAPPIFWLSCNLLQLSQADAHGALRKIHSLIRIPGPERGSDRIFLEAFHASFVDFITSPSRAGDYAITEPPKIMLAGALRILIESIDGESRVKVTWPYEEEKIVQRKLLHWAFETVFFDVHRVLSCDDNLQHTSAKLATFFQNLDYGVPNPCCNLTGDMFVYAEPVIFSILMDWGLSEMIPLNSIFSLDLDRVRSNEACQVGISDDWGPEDRRLIPYFFYQKYSDEVIRGKSPLSQVSNWRRRIASHFRSIMALRLRCPPRVYILGRGGRSAIVVVNYGSLILDITSLGSYAMAFMNKIIFLYPIIDANVSGDGLVVNASNNVVRLVLRAAYGSLIGQNTVITSHHD
ncbi:hypothetical protein NP233_g5082 [Leucocoprinus birnbaumii]|uniref:NACHT domain-containing protein n=1 Tax=Leucocoprinus birnbaumii TaxID=56174 RepID=A0AAD5YX19_9AGAR|nr:hypothetical protein NP233_g5082 [Leucocoprinus birnbaumii]